MTFKSYYMPSCGEVPRYCNNLRILLATTITCRGRFITAMSRRHGREKGGTRDIKITYDGLARADGSARFGFGKYFFFLPPVYIYIIIEGF